MQLSQLGEFAIIDKLTAPFTHHRSTTLLGVGDDAAIIAPTEGSELLMSTDLLLEGIHFDLVYTPLKHLGFKAISVNVSDICAMGGRAEQVVVSLGVSSKFELSHLEELYEGIRTACDTYGVDLVGGDTCPSMTGLTISVTVLGSAPKGKSIRRSGAKLHDLVCVSGDLGAACMGLHLCEREKAAFDGSSDFKPRFGGYEYLLERLLRPVARPDVVQALREKGIHPTAMMDVSDGIASELLHITKDSGVGCRIYAERLPVNTQTMSLAEEMQMDLLPVVLNGGEDYELIFTVPLGMKDLVESLDMVRIIGHITAASEGACLVARDGTLIPLTAPGFVAQ